MDTNGATQNDRHPLDEALTQLAQAQAEFARTEAMCRTLNAATDRERAEIRRESAESFARIETMLATIIRVLGEHSRMLERLPEAVREKIGFKGQPQAD